MKKIIYFRNRRVASSATQALFTNMKKEGYIDDWFGSGAHGPADRVKQMCIEQKGIKYWNQAIKVVSVRNVWDQHVSIFLMTRKEVHCKSNDLAKIFKTLPKRIQSEYIKEFRDLVDLQLQHWNNTSGLTEHSNVKLYDAGSRTDKPQNLPAPFGHNLGGYHHVYTIDRKPIVSHIIRMELEHLHSDLCRLLKDLNCPEHYADNFVESAKQFVTAPGHYDYRDFYNHETIKAIRTIKKAEIDILGYNFK